MAKAQEIPKGIHSLYKNLGETPRECLERFRAGNPEYADVPMTYAGRLDPMAEGLLVVLSGDAVNEKETYTALPKTYVFQMLWGFETDTLDILGKITETNNSEVSKEDVEKVLGKSVGKFEQVYPAYSSKPVSGKPLFQWAREGRLGEIEIPKHEVEVFKADFVSRRTVSSPDLLRYIVRDVSLVKGDFRQDEITSKWKEVLSKNENTEFVVDTIEVEVSSGFYVRQFVSDLAHSLGTVATTFHIKRTQIGDFSVDN